MDARDTVRRVVVETNPYWPFSALNRMPYRLAIAAVARRMRRLAGVRALYLRNGLTRPDWVPGISDIDLTLVTESMPDARREYALMRAIRDEYRALKRVFPMLGELGVLTPTTAGAWSRFGVDGYETRYWHAVFGDALPGLGFEPGPQRFRFDAWSHARLFGLDVLQRRMLAGDGASFLSVRELRRVAAKVLAHCALARGEPRTALPLPAGATTPAAVAAVALRHLDAAARSLDLSRVWADSPAAAAAAATGAPTQIASGEALQLRPGLAQPPSGIDAIVAADRHRIASLRDGLDLRETEACFAWIAQCLPAGELLPSVVTPAVLSHWLRHADPYLHTHVRKHGRMVYGAGAVLPEAPHERAFAHAVLAQAPNAIAAARSPEIVAPLAAAFVGGRAFGLAVERALFVRTLLACGTASSQYHEMAAESRRRYGDLLAQVGDIRARALRDADDAGLAAFALLRELADDVAAGVEHVDVDHLLFRRAGGAPARG